VNLGKSKVKILKLCLGVWRGEEEKALEGWKYKGK